MNFRTHYEGHDFCHLAHVKIVIFAIPFSFILYHVKQYRCVYNADEKLQIFICVEHVKVLL